MSKRILIPGGAGFIGSHLIDELLAHGFAVRILGNLLPQVHANAPGLVLNAVDAVPFNAINCEALPYVPIWHGFETIQNRHTCELRLNELVAIDASLRISAQAAAGSLVTCSPQQIGVQS